MMRSASSTLGPGETMDHVTYGRAAAVEVAPRADLDVEIAMMLLKTVLPVIVLLGTIGNALSFAVLVRKSMRSTPMYFYLTLLAVADTFVLFVSAFKSWIRLLTQFEVLHVSNVGCKVVMFVLLDSFYMSAWLVVLVTLDRFLVVWFPFRGYVLLRIRQARVTAAILTAIVAVYNIHVFWTFSLYPSRETGRLKCDALEDDFFMNHIFEYLKLISYCVIPFVTVVALNVGIIFKIRHVYSVASASHRARCSNSIISGADAEVAGYRNGADCPPAVLPVAEPLVDAGGNEALPVRWQQRNLHRTFASSMNGSTNSSQRRAPLDLQRLRQRRLTRMLLFISFAWLVLTAPFTLHSFMEEPNRLPTSTPVPSASLPPSTLPMSALFAPGLNGSAASSNCTSGSSGCAVSRAFSNATPPLARTTSTTLRPTTDDSFQNFLPSSVPLFDDEQHLHDQSLNVTESFLLESFLDHLVRSSSTASPAPPLSVVSAVNRASSSFTSSLQTKSSSNNFLVKTICFLLVYVNHAANFYLYCLTGNKFRRELLSMLGCRRRRTSSGAAVPAAGDGSGASEAMVQQQQQLAQLPGRLTHSPSSTSSRTRAVVMNMTPIKAIARQDADERYS